MTEAIKPATTATPVSPALPTPPISRSAAAMPAMPAAPAGVDACSHAIVRRLDETAPVPCPCGSAYRVLTGADGAPASLHFVDVKTDSEVHYHRTFTEIYTCLEGSGALELDGEQIPLTPGTVVAIPPGVRHRPIPGPAGTLRIINVAVPPFAPGDECLD